LPMNSAAAAALEVAAACHGLMLECADRELVSDYLTFRVRELGQID
jgi:hypothetical protein